MQKAVTVCLNMIVKNEASVIERCLNSVKKLVDYWVIVDTGSTDNTPGIIKNCLHDIPGKLYLRPWVNFAKNRNEALALAKDVADYIFILDADEELVFNNDNKPQENFSLLPPYYDAYYVEIDRGHCVFSRLQLIKSKINWFYKDLLHEYLYTNDSINIANLNNLKIKSYSDGARAENKIATAINDIRILKKELKKNPYNARYIFYIAQSYRGAYKLKEALEYYEKRIAIKDADIYEHWYSGYMRAKIKEELKYDWDEVLDDYLQLYEAAPERAEPLFDIAMHYKNEKNYKFVCMFLHPIINLDEPKNHIFVRRFIYEYLIAHEYIIAASIIGKLHEALNIAEKLLQQKNIPENILQAVKENKKIILQCLSLPCAK